MIDARRKRRALPPYDWALWFQAPALMLCFGGFALLAVFQAFGLNPFAVVFCGFLVGVVLNMLARQVCCPKCRKSLMVSYMGMKPSNPLRLIVFCNNFLPERICSDCGTRLDGSITDDA
jgi:hypothetical protein